MTLDLQIKSEPLVITTSLSEFYEKEIGICIPLGTYNSYIYNDPVSLRMLTSFLISSPPYLTGVKFTNLKGGEPKYVKIAPNIEMQHQETWDFIYKTWSHLLQLLIGKEYKYICYLTGWIFTMADLSHNLSPEYDGKMIKRGNDPRTPLLIECTPKFIEDGNKGLMNPKAHIWDYGTKGYILPKKEEDKIYLWANTIECSQETIIDFFNTIFCIFWVKYECEGIWILSHKINSDEIAKRLDIENINRAILGI
jgi:hypothetical protein